MQIHSEIPFITGKIKYWKRSIFDLDKFRTFDQDIREFLNQKLHLIFNPCYIQPPRPNTILGNIKETYRFDQVFLADTSDYIHHLHIGFGEKGYFYDIYLKKFDFEKTEWIDFIYTLLLFEQNLENKLETQLTEIYLNLEDVSADLENISIDNFSIAINTEKNSQFHQSGIPNYFKLTQDLEIKTNNFFFKNEFNPNSFIPEYTLRILPEKLFIDPIFAQKMGNHLKLKRFFQISPINIKKNIWEINSRGIILESVGKILESLFFT